MAIFFDELFKWLLLLIQLVLEDIGYDVRYTILFFDQKEYEFFSHKDNIQKDYLLFMCNERS